MLRKITKEIGRFQKIGDTHDYPLGVWVEIAKNLNEKLENFSTETVNPVLQNPLKGRLQIHKRLGATQ